MNATLRTATVNPAQARARRGTLTTTPIAHDPDGRPHGVRLELTEPDARTWLDVDQASALELAYAIPQALGRDGRLGLDSRAEITAARAEIAHRCDGPITAYVLIARALEAAAQGRHGYEALANALDAELQERGYLDPEAGEDERPGS